jgi:gliding motility-associated-like protein
MNRTILCIVCVLFFLKMRPQTIGGTVNIYTPVTSINCNTVNVISTSGFSANDRVLIIQMKGAIIDTSNTANFGTVTNLNNCGNFEFATISSVSGNTVLLQSAILNNYSMTGCVQLITIPQYTNVSVGSVLTCLPWNGTVGGVLVMEVSGTLTLNSDIDVSGMGFRGGALCQNPDGNCGSGYTDFFYPVNSGFGAEKGEGISTISSFKNGGKGPLANGGGGGNKHNSGGAGGGNYTTGGLGGKQANFCPPTPIGGVGGIGLNYTTHKLFLGGGGGCSDNNNGVGTTGTNGGGIIIVKANSLNGNSKNILSNGPDQITIPNFIGDGSGGGGAGGTILMDVNNYNSATNILASGGNGGGQDANYPSCFGSGGGGGTGIVCLSNASLPPNLTISTLPGSAGLDISTSSSCYNTSYGATSGQAGVGVKFNAIIPVNTNTSVITVDLGNNMSLACAQTLTLNAGFPGASYVWSTGAITPTIAVSTPGPYWVTVTACGATDSDTILITNVVNPIVVSLGNDISLACAQSATLSAYVAGGSYVWSTGAITPSITVSAPGPYWVTVTACNATDSDTILVSNILTPITVDLGNDTSLTCGQSIILNAVTQGGTYVWSTGATTSLINVSSPGPYWVEVTACGLSASDTIIISNLGNPIIVDLGNDTSLTCGQSLVLNAYSAGGSYVWSTGAVTSSINVSNPGSYWVTVAVCGITESDTIVVNNLVNPIVVNLGNDTSLTCTQSLILNAFFPGGSYVWSTGAITSSITVFNPGYYWVSVTACGVTSSDTVVISTLNNPVTVDLGNDKSLKCTEGIILNCNIAGVSYLWSTGETTSAILVSDSGNYWVTVNACGIIAADTILISGSINLDNDTDIPNVITPNGDGINDTITFGDTVGPELNLSIYNRWGQKIFFENKSLIIWKALFKSEPLVSGTYFWVLEYTSDCFQEKKVTKKGYISVF